MHNCPQHHPRGELAAADQRPTAGHAIAVFGEICLTRRPRAVGGDDVAIVVNGVRRLRRELGRGPMCIAVPDAPRDRGIGFGQFLEHRDPLHRRQVEPAIGGRQEDAKKAGTSEVAREMVGEPAGGLDHVALRHDALAELLCGRKQIAAGCRIPHHSLPRFLRLRDL